MAHELKGYAKKAEAKTHPFQYDRNSKAYAEGAWPLHNIEKQRELRRALERRTGGE